jgi:glycosyltransferase involved in cell wall biosynthesis
MKINVTSDVSFTSNVSYAAGVQRVMVETHKHLCQSLDETKFLFRGLNLNNGNKFRSNEYLSSDKTLNPPYLDIENSDIVLCFDGNNGFVCDEISKRDTRPILISLAYDVLPMLYPQFFEGTGDYFIKFKVYMLRMFKFSDFIICNSEETKKSLLELNWRTEAKIIVFPLGAFDSGSKLSLEKRNPFSLISINTIEPRKGHDDLLDAFDYLISQGFQVELNIVGKYGWASEKIRNRIESHALLNKMLFWHQGISDELVLHLYDKSGISIVAARAEGFGLTLEEGLLNGCKVIARNITTFKERSNPNLFFFEGAGKELAMKIIEVSEIPWNPEGISQIRTMKDFAEDVANLSREIAEDLPNLPRSSTSLT